MKHSNSHGPSLLSEGSREGTTVGDVNAGLLVAVTGVLLGTALTVSAFLVSTAGGRQPVRPSAVPAEALDCQPDPGRHMAPDVQAPAHGAQLLVEGIATAPVPSLAPGTSARTAGPCAAASCKDRAREASTTAG